MSKRTLIRLVNALLEGRWPQAHVTREDQARRSRTWLVCQLPAPVPFHWHLAARA